jgi:CheY-like chemotaxis protein
MKVLIADQSRVARRILREMIAELAPEIEVDAAEDGGQAVAMHELRRYDLIFLDIAMPDMDGLAALTVLRQADPRVGLVMLSALEDVTMDEHAQRAGATAFLAKPFSALDLQGVLTLLTKRPAAARVLIVDDSRAQRAILRTTLEGSGVAFSVEEAGGGAEGLRKALSRGHDLIFLDVNMPDLSGADVLREIKRAQTRVKVAMTSADLSEELLKTIADLGGDACIKKPFIVAELLATVTEMLDARRPPRRPAA